MKSQIKYCFWRWLPNVGLTSQQQPYSRLKLPHNPDDHIPPTFEMTPRLKPSTVKKKLKFASYCTFTTQSACFYLLRGFGIHAWLICQIWAEETFVPLQNNPSRCRQAITSRFSSQMDLRKFAPFVFLLNLGILPLTVKGMPVSSFHRRPLQSAFVCSYT